MKTKCLALCLCLFFAVTAKAVEPFKAEYDLYYKWIKLGHGRYTLEALENEQYRFVFDSYLSFLFFVDERQVESRFHVVDERFVVDAYQHERTGTGDDYLEQMTFSPQQGEITAAFLHETLVEPYDSGIIDGLTAQLQLMYDVRYGASDITYQIFEVVGLKQRDFIHVMDETVTVNKVSYDCVVYEVKRPEKQFETRIWFAKELDYFPVQLIHYSKGKKQFQAKLKNYQPES